MAQLEPNKWHGMDVLSLLMGGNDGKLKAAGEGLSELAAVMEQIQELQNIINTGIDTATNAVINGLESALKLNPVKETLNQIGNTVKDAVTDLKGTGVYFLNMNEAVPPLWASGFTMEEASRGFTISQLKAELREKRNNPTPNEDEQKEIDRLTNRITVEEEKLRNIRGNNYGGIAKYMQVFNESLTDDLDFNRPIFTDNAAIAALFIMFGSSSLTSFWRAWESFRTLINEVKAPPVDGFQPLQDLTVKYVTTKEYDQVYVQQATYWQKAETLAARIKQQAGGQDIGTQIAALVIRNKESNKIEEIRPVLFTQNDIEAAKNAQVSLEGARDTQAMLEAAKSRSSSKIPVSVFENESDKYYSLREINCLLNIKAVGDLGLDPDDFYHDGQGNISYIKGGKSFDFLRAKNIDKFDPSAPDSAKGNVHLFWKYPKQSFILTKLFSKTHKTWEGVVIVKKKVTTDNPSDDLLSLYRFNGLPKKSEAVNNIEVKEEKILKGLRKSYYDEIEETIDVAFENGVLGYDYMVGASYSVGLRIWVSDGVAIRPYVYPIYVTLHDETTSKSVEIKARLSAERKAILELIDNVGTPEMDETRKMLIEKYSDPEKPDYEIPVKPITFSNVASLTIPIDYDLGQSTPPDWQTFPHLTMLMPKIFQIIDNIVAWIDTILNYVSDAFDALKEIGEALKVESSFYLNKLLGIIRAISDIIRAISDLSVGAYIMTTSVNTGGLSAIKKILAMSLQGNIEDVPWSDNPDAFLKFQQGPPPFGRDDYIGGYVLLGGAPDFLVELMSRYLAEPAELFDDLEGVYDQIVDTFSDAYDVMADAGDKAKTALQDAYDDIGDEIERVKTELDNALANLINSVEDQARAQWQRLVDNLRGQLDDLIREANDKVIPDGSVIVPDKSTEAAETIAYLRAALDALNSGDLLTLAGSLCNSMDCSNGLEDRYKAAGEAASKIKNYDCSDITDPALLAFINALLNCNRELMCYAAELLLLTGVRFPHVLSLYQDPECATLYNTFKLLMGQALAEQLSLIPIDESLRNVTVVIDPLNNVADRSVDVEKDTIQTGLNVIVFPPDDTRILETTAGNIEWTAEVINESLEVLSINNYWETTEGNIEWEVTLFNEALVG